MKVTGGISSRGVNAPGFLRTDIAEGAPAQLEDTVPNGETVGSGELSQHQRGEGRPADGSFEEFYRSNYNVLKILALRVGATHAEAEDAAMEAMVQAFQAWATLSSPLAWAKTATLRIRVKARRRDRRRIELTEYAARAGRLKVENELDLSLNVWEDNEWCQQLLGMLPSAQREVMECAMLLLTPTEVGELLGKTPGTIRANLFKARQSLRAELDRQEGATNV